MVTSELPGRPAGIMGDIPATRYRERVKGGSYSSHVFLPFSYGLHSSNEICDTSASSAAFFEVRSVR